ncbi:MAG: hypothetical protein IH958_02630, partial [Chloroflexi bacterium]|nr:hypothetical protein [Chloroflexota bacterium]
MTIATFAAIALGLYPVQTAVAQAGGCVDGQICADDADCPGGVCDAALRACICKCAPPGDDCFTTLCNGNTFVDFSAQPIPPDFFFPGSPPFGSSVVLGGAGGFPSDTTVKRQQQMCFPGPLPQKVNVAVEVTQLDLVSCTCLSILGQQFEMHVVLDGGAQSIGSLSATKEDAKGGTFSSNLSVNVEIWFEPCGGGARTPPIFQFVSLTSSGNHWLQDDPNLTFCGASGFFP